MTTIAATQFLSVVATADAAKDFLIVSVHDIAPSSQAIAEKTILELAHRGVRVCSLLVVPDYHHEGLATKDRQFISWLRDLEAAGHEIVIHGYFHERIRRPDETMRDKFFTRVYSDDEGEFYDLGYDEAFRRIVAARDEFRGSGLKPKGFVAPAWLLGDEAERAARDAEMEYTTRLQTVHDLISGENFSARSIVYSVRSNWRRKVSLGWNAASFRLLKTNPLLRISVHPPDYSHPAIWRQIAAFASRASESRIATTYQDWIAEQRQTPK